MRTRAAPRTRLTSSRKWLRQMVWIQPRSGTRRGTARAPDRDRVLGTTAEEIELGAPEHLARVNVVHPLHEAVASQVVDRLGEGSHLDGRRVQPRAQCPGT